MAVRFEAQSWLCLAQISLPDGRHAVAGTENGQLIVWDVETNSEVRPHLEGPTSHLGIAATPDGTHVLTSDADGSVRLWRLPLRHDTAKPGAVPPRVSPCA